MKPEIFFLKYAFPCSFVLLSRKEITKEEHKLLYKSAKEEKLYLPIEKIEKIFWRALEFIGSISDLDLVQKYWWFNHNKYIKREKIKNLDKKLLKDCMIIPCKVLSVNKNNAVVKSEFDDFIKLKIDFVKVKPGDKVTKHYDYVCEKISESLYTKMVKNLKKLQIPE
jgi:hydrogenase maturation factor